MSQLPAPLAPWSAHLDLFPHDLALALGPLVRRLAAGIGSAHAAASAPGDDPDGYDGLDRRGDFERLLLSEWLLADALGDEFLRRASAGELAFLKPKRRAPALQRTTVALLDSGPQQIGAPRLAHLAALIVLARRAESAGWPLLWAPLSEPDGPLHDGVTVASVGALLASRTTIPASGDALAAWRARLPAGDDLWLIGGSDAAALPEARGLSTLAIAETDDGSLDVRVGRGAPLTLELPPADDCVRLLREPFRRVQTTGRTLEAGLTRLIFAPGGRKLWTRTADGRTLLAIPVPRSRREPPGAPKRHTGQPGETLLAADTVSGGIFVLFLRPEGVRLAHIGRKLKAPAAGLYAVDADLGAALALEARDGLRRCLVPGHHDSASLWLERRDGAWTRLRVDPERGVIEPVPTESPFLAQRQADAGTLVHLHRHGERLLFDSGSLVSDAGTEVVPPVGETFFGYDSEQFVYAYRSDGGWLLTPGDGVPIEPEPDDEVVGVVGAPPDRGEYAMLVTVSAGRRIVRLTSASHRHTLPGFGGRLVQATVSNDRPLLAAELDTGELVVYDLFENEMVARIALAAPRAEPQAPGRNAALGLPNAATAVELLERALDGDRTSTLLALQPHRGAQPAVSPADLRAAIDDLLTAFRGIGALCGGGDGILLVLTGKRHTAATGPLQSHGLVRRGDGAALRYAVGIVEASGSGAETLHRALACRDRALREGGDRFVVEVNTP